MGYWHIPIMFAVWSFSLGPIVDTPNLPQYAKEPVGLHMWGFGSVGVGVVLILNALPMVVTWVVSMVYQ